VPAVDSIEIFPVLLVDTGAKIISKMSDGSGYIINFMNPDINGTCDINGSKYSIVAVKVSIDEMEKFAKLSYCDDVDTLDLILRKGLQSGPDLLMNIYIKRYTVGKKYSTIQDATKVNKRTAKQGTLSYNVYYGQPFNIDFDMAMLARTLSSTESVQTVIKRTGKQLRSL
jgi:hypothetical protein